MARVVQKYGGSSVADLGRVRAVAQRVMATRATGKEVVVVVSAMGDTTDHLLKLAREISRNPPRRELDMLLSVGERISMALLCMAIRELGGDAISFTGSQCGIITNGQHFNARIVEVRPARVEQELGRGRIVVVAGYQGVSEGREITTLGRGGSDTTAVALAAALGADCEIFSDVDGVYSADPNVVEGAHRLVSISYEQMQEFALAGAKVLNAQAVEFAKRNQIIVHACGAGTADGTRIGAAERECDGVLAIAGDPDMLLLRIRAEPLEFFEFLETHQICGKELNGSINGEPLIWMLIAREAVPDCGALAASLERSFGRRAQLLDEFGSVSAIGCGLNQNHRLMLQGTKALAAPAVAFCGSSARMTWMVSRVSVRPCMVALHRELVEKNAAKGGGRGLASQLASKQ